MIIFKTRYQADKERKENPFRNNEEKIIKVSGGYTLMTPDEYYTWENQK